MPAYSASFDCTKAASAREKLICADAELSSVDSKLAELYAGALARLSEDGRRLVRDSQREWLKVIGQLCFGQATSDRQSLERAIFCLKFHYRDRMGDFGEVAVQRGPYMFSRVDHYQLSPAQDSEGVTPPSRPDGGDIRLAVSHVAYPRIDQPMTSATKEWNTRNVRTGAGVLCGVEICGPGCDNEIIYRIGLANASVISEEWGGWGECVGQTHGAASVKIENFLMSSPPRRLRSTDLFRSDRGWTAKISIVAVAQARRQLGDMPGDVGDNVSGVAKDPNRWFLRPEGLAVPFQSYELGCYTCVPDILIPWSDLKDVMISSAPIP